jgi:hypothetical protein
MLNDEIKIEKNINKKNPKKNKTLFKWIVFCEEGYIKTPSSFSFLLN